MIQCFLRIHELQAHLTQLEQFSHSLLDLTQWSENFLRHIQSTCTASITDLKSVDSKIKVHFVFTVYVVIVLSLMFLIALFFFRCLKEDMASLKTQEKSVEALQPHLDALSPSLAPKDLQHLQTKKDDCFQLFSETRSLVDHRDETLLKLKAFYETFNKSQISLKMYHEAVEGKESWDSCKVRDINEELGDLAKELASLEVQAISLDINLNKAHLHLQGVEGERTSCRELVDDVASSLQVLQRSVGTKQSEAEALATLWSSFRGRKELLLGSLAKLEDRVNIPWPAEVSTQAFQQRYTSTTDNFFFFIVLFRREGWGFSRT